MPRVDRWVSRTSILAAMAVLLAGCGHMPTVRWPWSARPAAPLETADELVVTLEESTTVASFPQYWKRNTLVLDLQGVSGSGSVAVRPRTGTQWPVRLALRVMPGQVGTLEVQADQRVVLPITPDGSKPVDLELSPGVYTPKTAQIVVRWGSDTGCCGYSSTER